MLRPLLTRFTAALLFSICALSLIPSSARAVVIDGVAARINTEIITLYEVQKAVTPYLLQRGMEPNTMQDPQQRQKLYRAVLEDLIEQKLLLQEAAKIDLEISDADVDQWLGAVQQQQGLDESQFRQLITSYGMSYDDYREVTRLNLLRLQITRLKVGAKVDISGAEVDEAYRRRYGAEAAETETYITVSHVLIQPENTSDEARSASLKKAWEARSKLEEGTPFSEVAQNYSDGPSAQKGGELGTFRRGELDEEFEKVAFDLPLETLSEPVLTKFGYHVILVTGIEERENSAVLDRKDEIRGQLRQGAMERQLGTYVESLKSRAFIDVRF